MPIKPIVLQRRHAELGRIRLGHKQGGNGRPVKLAAFRFTSPSERYIKDLAELYGGEPRPWDNNGVPSFEVFTEAKSIPVIAIKGGLSQWLETWSGGGCVHRCDGEVNVLTNERCNPEDPAHKDAKPTTRLSVMLPELEAVGAWRMESKGWNAAAEIPAVAELAQFVGDMVPAHLNLVERRSIKDGKTSRFVVPVLDLHIGTARLREIVAEKAGLGEIESGGQERRPALEAGSSSRPDGDVYAPFLDQVAKATSYDDLTALWELARGRGLVGSTVPFEGRHVQFVEVWKARALELKPADDGQAAQQPTPGAAAQPDEDGIVDAELVGDDDGDAVWQQILKVAGEQGLGFSEVTEHFSSQMGGLIPDDASAGELRAYLAKLQAGTGAAA